MHAEATPRFVLLFCSQANSFNFTISLRYTQGYFQERKKKKRRKKEEMQLWVPGACQASNSTIHFPAT